MVAIVVLFVVATIAFLDDDDIEAKGERKDKVKKKERKKRKRKGGCYDRNMVLPSVFWKFFFHNFKVPKPHVASIPKRVLTLKIIAKSQNVQAIKNEIKNAPPNYNFINCNKTNKMQTLSKHNYTTLTTIRSAIM
jgi:hypothetical protein